MSAPSSGSRLTADYVGRLLSVLLTTVGVAGVVAATGGAILWARFWAAGLPPGAALAVIPKTELIASGAATLALFVLLGLLAVLVVFALDDQGRASTRMGIVLCLFIAVELLVVCRQLWDGGQGWIPCAIVSFLPAALALWLHLWRQKRMREQDAAARKAAKKQAAARTAVTAWNTRSRACKVRDRIRGKCPPLDVPPDAKPKPVGDTWVWIERALVVFAIVVGVFYVFSQSKETPGVDWVAACAVVVAGVLGALCFGVANRSHGNFIVTAMAVFFSTLLFGAVIATARTVQHPKLSPIALLRKTDHGLNGVLGFYVARTDDRYWLAAVSSDCNNHRHVVAATGLNGRGRIFSLSRDTVTDDEQGAMLDLVAARDPDEPRLKFVDPNRQAQLLMDELLRRQAPGTLAPEMVSGRKGQPGSYSRSLDPPVSPCRPKGHALQAHIRVGRSAENDRRLEISAGPAAGKVKHYDWTVEESDGRRRTSVAPKLTYDLPYHSGTAEVTLTVSGEDGPSDGVSIQMRRLVDSTGWFHAGRAVLTRRGRAAVQRFARTLQPASVRMGYIDGRANTGGRDNVRLAKRRARHVLAALVRAQPGLTDLMEVQRTGPSSITTNDTGKSKDKLANRTIDIMIIGEETTA